MSYGQIGGVGNTSGLVWQFLKSDGGTSKEIKYTTLTYTHPMGTLTIAFPKGTHVPQEIRDMVWNCSDEAKRGIPQNRPWRVMIRISVQKDKSGEIVEWQIFSSCAYTSSDGQEKRITGKDMIQKWTGEAIGSATSKKYIARLQEGVKGGVLCHIVLRESLRWPDFKKK